MAVTRAKKIESVEKLGKDLQKVSSLIVTTYSKLTVPQDYELRKLLRSSGAKYAVVKNTLAERAAKGTKLEQALTGLSGVTSIAYTEGDPVALAKALAKYAKDNPEFTFKAGVVEGRVVSIQGDRVAGDHAFEGRNLLQAAVPDDRAGAASGDGDERCGTRPGGGDQPGRRKAEVCERRSRGSVKDLLGELRGVPQRIAVKSF
jgi:ribosomal protein L10